MARDSPINFKPINSSLHIKFDFQTIIQTINTKLKYYRPPQPIQPSLASPNHPESKYTIHAQTVQIIEKGDGKIQNSP